MEDGETTPDGVIPHTSELMASTDPVDSTLKISSTELSPDSTSEMDMSTSKTERMDTFVAGNKVNGDCGLDCSVPSPSSLPTNNNNSSEFKISAQKNSHSIEKPLQNDISDSAKCETVKMDCNISNDDEDVTKDVDQSTNLSHTTQSENFEPHGDERTQDNEELQCNENNKTTMNEEVSSTLEEKISCEANDISTCVPSSKPAINKLKKVSDSITGVTNKINESFKPPLRYELKSSTKLKTNESTTSSESNQKQSDAALSKTNDKPNRNNKRKNDDKQPTAGDIESNEIEKFPIQYKGFKKKATVDCDSVEKRVKLKWNPFNPACKPNRKSNKCIPSRHPVGEEIDCSSLQQSEYAQYLGLQPILKFRCSNCGSSAFQSMVALNTHQMECTKGGKGKVDKLLTNLPSPVNEPKSTNIKLTRKVFLCSACGTYYEHWNLFLHMREVHRRYICLYCLSMFSIAEKLSEHLIQKHKVTSQNFGNLEDFQKNSYQTFFLLCLTCDKVFSEMDDFYGHICTSNKKSIEGVDSSNKTEAISNQEANATLTSEACTTVSNSKSITRRTRESNKRNATTNKSSQLKKDETTVVNTNSKAEEAVGSVENKDETLVKSCEVSANKVPDSTSNENSSENKVMETSSRNENDVIKHPPKSDTLVESHAVAEGTPSLDKVKVTRKSKVVTRRMAAKRKKQKEKEEESGASSPKVKKISEEESPKEDAVIIPATVSDDNVAVPPTSEISSNVENEPEAKEEPMDIEVPTPALLPEPIAEEIPVPKDEEEQAAPEVIENSSIVNDEESNIEKEAPKEELPPASVLNANIVESKTKLQVNLLKFKLPGVESDNESDDSQKLSLVVDETTNSDTDNKIPTKCDDASATDSDEQDVPPSSQAVKDTSDNGTVSDNITLAGEHIAVMALTLDDKIENIPIQTVLKECVRTSCMSCNYCRHAVKIAVNGKQLALHILSEHRYMPIKNETTEDVIIKLKTSLETLQTMFFNTETYDSTDSTIHVPYDKDSSFDCFQCNYVTTTHRDLFAHKRKSHTKSLLLCIMCKSNFYSYSELLCHLCPGTYNAEVQFHNVDINFRCCFCRLDTIPSAFRLMVHLRKTHHTCDICLENGVDQQKLSTHMWKHKLNHLCYRCGIAYASKPDITKHLFWKHGHESVLCKKCLQKKWPHVYHFCIPPTSFICEECNTSFSKAVALKVHKRMHGNDYPYSCNECNKTFISKKLLQRHEARHFAINNNVQNNGVGKEAEDEEESKQDEIINVSDVINENKEASPVAADLSDSKEMEHKDKSHKKHKKDKDKKDKQVVDVYDLPPLNLSSESDSSDEDNNANENCNIDKFREDKKEGQELDSNIMDFTGSVGGTNNTDIDVEKIENPPLSPTSLLLKDENIKEESSEHPPEVENSVSKKDVESEETMALLATDKTDEKVSEDVQLTEVKPEAVSSSNENANNDNEEIEEIWKNFYSTNPQNSNLPYPLCAIKSEIAYGIIMGDHDYCHQPIQPPSYREDLPSTSGLTAPLINDQLEEEAETTAEKISDTSILKDTIGTPSPLSSPKKKPKSPKKKNSKVENENNSSSSSDSSSESSSSSCSCGPNCSCSSSSSNSSSSSSSDTDSSAGEEVTKQERKRKKRERRSKTKSDHEPEVVKEPEPPPHPENIVPVEPIDPPIRESELDTDETTTDEEFYDQQPQRIANQLLAEKRNQLMLLASAANVNNGNASPSPIVDVVQPEVVTPVKQKVKTKRKRKVTTKGRASLGKNIPNSHPYPHYPKDNEPVVSKPAPQQYHSNVLLPAPEPKLPTFVVQQSPALAETTGSGSETEKSRSSKRRRIPNKFYGYSSGEEEEKPTPSPKWRSKPSENVVQQSPTVRIVPPLPAHPPTPRIQLTVPKQIIRKPLKMAKIVPPKVLPPPPPQPPQHHQQSSSDSTDSGSEAENQRLAPNIVVAPPPMQSAAAAPTATTTSSQKNDKDVYCYCRCPYDEVSEMIACDDENCEIEWFHFECVGILVPPRGQWFCPGCRKARGLPT